MVKDSHFDKDLLRRSVLSQSALAAKKKEEKMAVGRGEALRQEHAW